MIQNICNIQDMDDQDNQALIELKNILSHAKHENWLLLHLAMEMHEIKRSLEKDYHSDFALKSVIFKNMIATETRKLKQNLAVYDLSFLSSQARQTVPGNVAKSRSILLFRPYLNIMESTFWHIDDKQVFYMTAAEKSL